MIADFGVTSEGMTQKLKTTVRARGSPGYRAPELIGRRHAAYSKESDIWALGCILYELAYGMAAFTDDFVVHGFESIEELSTPDIGSHSRFTDALRTDFLTPMLEPQYTNRPPARRLVERLLRCLSCISDEESPVNDLSDCVIGTDGPMSPALPRWDDLFLPGEQHSAMFERYRRVSKARDTVLGKYHPASIWSASRVAWGTFYRSKERITVVPHVKTLFEALADRQVHGRAISQAQQKTDVLATDVGVALACSDLEQRTLRLRDLMVAYRRTFAATDPLNIDALRAESLLQHELQLALQVIYTGGNVSPLSTGRSAEDEARLWNILSIQTEKLGPSHCDTLETLERIGELCWRFKEYDQARKFLEMAEKAGARLGPAHINQARCMYYLADCYMELSLPLAVRLQQLDPAWESLRVVYGESHSYTSKVAQMILEYLWKYTLGHQ